MARGRSRSQWRVASCLIAAIYNTVRDPDKRPQPFCGDDFNPYVARKPKRPPGIEGFGMLVGMSIRESRKAAGLEQ